MSKIQGPQIHTLKLNLNTILRAASGGDEVLEGWIHALKNSVLEVCPPLSSHSTELTDLKRQSPQQILILPGPALRLPSPRI